MPPQQYEEQQQHQWDGRSGHHIQCDITLGRWQIGVSYGIYAEMGDPETHPVIAVYEQHGLRRQYIQMIDHYAGGIQSLARSVVHGHLHILAEHRMYPLTVHQYEYVVRLGVRDVDVVDDDLITLDLLRYHVERHVVHIAQPLQHRGGEQERHIPFHNRQGTVVPRYQTYELPHRQDRRAVRPYDDIGIDHPLGKRCDHRIRKIILVLRDRIRTADDQCYRIHKAHHTLLIGFQFQYHGSAAIGTDLLLGVRHRVPHGPHRHIHRNIAI